MNASLFWQEEIRCFPHGCRFISLWVFRRDGPGPDAPLRMLFHWTRGWAPEGLSAAAPPLGAVRQALDLDREGLRFPGREAALWVEPIRVEGKPQGALAMLFEADEAWREGVFLWGQRLAARMAPVFPQLEVLVPAGQDARLPHQLDLFPEPGPGAPVTRTPHHGKGRRRWAPGSIPLPRPLTIPGIPGAVGVSEEMKALGRILANIAGSGANVLLRGESGTGKEVIASALHAGSPRCRRAFVGQNCAALPVTLFESELFGHVAGAFTGARGDKKGLLAAADGGTFFLDEIGDMPLPSQIKLLRVMQERRVRRIGDVISRPVDIRFIAATHRDLSQEISAGRFRLDLYYRLKVVSLDIPPLRQRPEDILHLLSYFLIRHGRKIDGLAITEPALATLQAWRWPGNVRELENEILRMLALFPELDLIGLEHLSPDVRSPAQGRIEAADLGILRNLNQAGAMLEQYLIRKALAVTGGRKAMAARRLGLSRQGLYKKIARHKMVDLIVSPQVPSGQVNSSRPV